MQVIPERNSAFSQSEHEKNKAILRLGPCKACHKKGFAFAFKYNSLVQYDWDFFVFCLHLFLLWRNQSSNMLMLYCASKNKESIQADIQQGKGVDIFNIFVIREAALNCFQYCLQVNVNHWGLNPFTPCCWQHKLLPTPTGRRKTTMVLPNWQCGSWGNGWGVNKPWVVICTVGALVL